MLLCSALSALLGHLVFSAGSSVMRASRSVAQYGLPRNPLGVGDDGVSQVSMPAAVAGAGFVASATLDAGGQFRVGSTAVSGVSRPAGSERPPPSDDFRDVLDECARRDWARPLHNSVDAQPLISPPPWPNAPLVRFLMHGQFGVPVTRDALLWTQYVFGCAMYLFFVVAGVYDGSVVFSFALGFLLLVVLEEAEEGAKLRAAGAARPMSVHAPLWLAHTLALIAAALGLAVSKVCPCVCTPTSRFLRARPSAAAPWPGKDRGSCREWGRLP